MEIQPTELEGCFLLKPRIFEDERGFFYESYNKKKFEEAIGQSVDFVQDNQSHSKYGTLRGLHMQLGEFAQAKLVRVLSGEVLDVVVDLRVDSPTYGKHLSFHLKAEEHTQLYVPRGFAHGFIVLSEAADFLYKTDNFYAPNAEAGIHYADPALNIDWKIKPEEMIISAKDAELPTLEEFTK